MPTEETDHDFETLEITTEDQKIEALITNQESNEFIIYFGGNAEDVAYSASDFKHHFTRHNTYLMRYRGYGGAEGSPSEQAIFADALALYDHIKKNPNTRISVIGRSLGSGVATYLATQRPIEKLVLITPFDSVRQIAQKQFPFLPVQWLLKDHFDSKSMAHKIESPTLVVVANQDQVIARSHTESLIQSIPKTLLTTTFINAGHNDLDLIPEYFASIKHFIH